LLWRSANAQASQFLPEVDVYSRIQPDIRFNFQAKDTREAGDPTQAEIDRGFDFFLRPLLRLKGITVFGKSPRLGPEVNGTNKTFVGVEGEVSAKGI
jgi:hypothetical protein